MARKSPTPAMLNILIALSGGEKHGYAIMLGLDEMSGGTIKMGPATLYRSLRSLAEMGLIEESAERPAPGDDERRRYYRLTASGEKVAAEEASRLEQLVVAARRNGLLGSSRWAGADG